MQISDRLTLATCRWAPAACSGCRDYDGNRRRNLIDQRLNLVRDTRYPHPHHEAADGDRARRSPTAQTAVPLPGPACHWSTPFIARQRYPEVTVVLCLFLALMSAGKQPCAVPEGRVQDLSEFASGTRRLNTCGIRRFSGSRRSPHAGSARDLPGSGSRPMAVPRLFRTC